VHQDIFNSLAGYVTVFHEFMHCNQFLLCEEKIKNELLIAQKALAANDYMWELNHKFPYNDSIFIDYYSHFLSALDEGDESGIKYIRVQLNQYLTPIDYEYMIWQEWKEGFARFIENKIKHNLNLVKNIYGCEKPFNRVTFYYGGEKFIGYLASKNPELCLNIERLFYHIKNYINGE